jgi:hypothetical protein
VPTYRLKCVLRFTDGRAGAAFDAVDIGADGSKEAITLAQMYRPSTPGMVLSVAVLTDKTGSSIWSLRAPDHVDLEPECPGRSAHPE